MGIRQKIGVEDFSFCFKTNIFVEYIVLFLLKLLPLPPVYIAKE